MDDCVETKAELRRTDEILRRLIDQNPHALAMLDRDMRYLAASRRWIDELVHGDRDIIGRTHYEVFPEIPEHWKAIHQRCLAGAFEHSDGEEFHRADGTIDYIRWDVRPWRDARGEIGGILMFTEDITERHRLEREREDLSRQIAESEAKFRLFAEAMPQMAFITDAAGNVTYYNGRFYEYTGLGPESQGWGWRDGQLHHPDDVDRTVATWIESLRTGQLYEMEYRMRRHDGAYRWHLGRAEPVRDGDGRITQWIGTNTDIHEAKEAQQRMQEAIRARDEFLSLASHELKTPLTSMQLQGQLVQRAAARGHAEALTPARFLQHVEKTDRQLSRIARLVDDMLDVSRIAAGRLEPRRERVDLGRLVEDVADRLLPHLAEAGCELRLDAPVGLAFCQVDAFQIEQVVTNLLTNAFKYGGGRPVSVEVRREGDRGIISVRDEGRGVAAEDHERIFLRFERSVSGSEISGLGLGLYISHRIIEAHGGTIRVESEVGRGARFLVELPLSPDAEPEG